MKRCTISILTLFLFHLWVTGQDYHFKHFDADDGLSRNTVFTTLLSEEGFLWVGTKDGLNRFDGHNFRVFKNHANNPKSLGSNYIESLHEYNGKLWVGTDTGLFLFDGQRNEFEAISQSKGLIRDIEHDDDGNLWYISGFTLFRYDHKNKKNLSYDAKTFLHAEDITRSADGSIWIAHEGNLYKHKRKSDTFEKFEIQLQGYDLPVKISKLFFLNTDILLLGTENHGVLQFDLTTKKTTTLYNDAQSQVFIRDFLVKDDKELWIATETGLYIYDLETKKVNHLQRELGNPYSIADNAVYSLTLDNENGVWLGTYFAGLSYYPQNNVQFEKFFAEPNSNSISGNAVREIHQDEDGHLWIGTEDAGLNRFDLKSGTFKNYTAKQQNKGLSHYNIHALLPERDKLWVGTFEHGLDVMDINSGQVIKRYCKSCPNTIPGDFILDLQRTSTGELLAVTSSGIFKHDAEADNFVNHEVFPEGVFFTSILEDSNAKLWAGSYGSGLYTYDINTKKLINYRYDASDSSSISSNSINGIFQDSEDSIWISTENGLSSYKNNYDNFKRYTDSYGFPSNVFYAILEDDAKRLWISTSKGLVNFDPNTGRLSTYTKSHGLLSDQFNYASAFKDDSGTLYFGSIGGMIRFRPDLALNTPNYDPPLYITDFEIHNGESASADSEVLLGKSIVELSNIVLRPEQSSFSVAFAALSYTAPEVTEYWYKLEGLNDDWIYLEHTPKINFTALGAGDYSLSVKSKNIHGMTSISAMPLNIEVLPVFWRSTLAYLLYLAVALLIGYLIYQYFRVKAKARNYRMVSELESKRDKEVFQAKVEFFTNVSHEIRTPLTLIKTPLEKLLKKSGQDKELKDNLTVMEKNTGRLLDLTNQLLDLRQAEIETVSLTFVNTNISELVRKTYFRFSPSIIDRGLNVTMDLDNKDTYAFVDAEAIRKIISNLFSNALKYGEHHISIGLKAKTDFFEIRIQNDGPVIPSHLRKKIFEPFYRNMDIGNQNKSGSGLGLALAHSLTELHHGSLYLDTGNAAINSFVLRIPLHQENEITLFETSGMLPESDGTTKSKTNLMIGMKPSILLVDDNLDLLDFIAKELSDDYIVLKAVNASQGLELVKIEAISLVISDVMMPGTDGFEFCEKLKSEIESSHIPVILLTVKRALEAKLLGLEHGADAYIEKPFSMDHLKVQIANLIRNRIKIIEHFSNSPLAHIRSMAHSKTDENFIDKLDALIRKNLSNPDINVDTLAESLHMSRSTFYRKIRELSNLNPNELLNIARLKKAAELLESGNYKIYEIADMVGYKSQSSFGRNFQKQFDMSPSEYMKKGKA